MILYYALGGGLGHIARSFALIEHAPQSLKSRIRIFVSSKSAHAAEANFPCSVDRVPDWAMADTGRYEQFLAAYFEKHRFTCVVMDAFPFGLLGEMKYIMPNLPRILVGRYLRWEAYHHRCGGIDNAIWPTDAVVIEEQEDSYSDVLRSHCSITEARWPISPARADDMPILSGKPACCIVHSGSETEMDQLMKFAEKIMADKDIPGPAEVFTPEKKIFPMERYLSSFSDVVTGAGYASCAAAALLQGRVRYHLHPFHRRFDDQVLRLRRLKSGVWIDGRPGDASRAAAILWELVGHCA